MLVVPVISVDAYPFLGFLRPDLPPWGYRNKCFLVALCHLILRRPNLEVATKRILLHQQKYQSSFSAMLHMEVSPYSYFWLCGYFWGPWVSFVMTDEFSVRVTKITSRIGVSQTHCLSFNLKGFHYSYAWSCSLLDLSLEKLCRFLLMFLIGFFHSIYAQFLIPFHLA